MVFWIPFVGVTTLDQISKGFIRSNFVPGQSLPLLGEWLKLVYTENPGAAFGIFSGARWLFIATSSISIILTMLLYPRLKGFGPFMPLALGLIAGGALGNLIDRMKQVTVTDFIYLKHFPAVFNLADLAIVLGCFVMGIFLISSYRIGQSDDK